MLQINSYLLRIFIILAFICLAVIQSRIPEIDYSTCRQVQASSDQEIRVTDDVRSVYLLTKAAKYDEIRAG
ncbi:unnamed protein product [Gordionus sp. m RMFG-2023]